jgi:hypothetical protein
MTGSAKSGMRVQACTPLPDFTSFNPGYALTAVAQSMSSTAPKENGLDQTTIEALSLLVEHYFAS